MAYIVSVTESSVASAASTGSIAFPSHNTDDLLLVCLTNEGGGTNFAVTGGTGWALIGTGAQSGTQRQQWAYKIATGSGDDPTFSGATNEWIVAAIVVRDAHATTPFGSLVSGTDFVRDDYNAVGSKDSGALTTAVDDCLLMYSWSIRQGAAVTDLLTVAPDAMTIDSLYSYALSAQVAHIIGHRQTGAAAAAPTIKVYTTNATQGGSGWVLAIRNKASGILQPDARVGAEVVKWYGDFGTAFETLTYSSLSTLTTDTIAGLAISTATPGGGTLTITHTTADTPNPPGRYTNIQTIENSAGIWVGTSHAVTANMSGKVLSLQWQVASISTAQLGSNGWIVLLSDGTKWVAYQLSPLLSTLAVDTAYTNQIAVGEATAFATHASGEPDFTAITSIGFAWHRAGLSGTARGLNIRRLMLLDTAKIVGGASTLPTKFSQLADNAMASRVRKLCDKQGKGQVLAKGKVQIGDGVVPTYFKLAAQSLEYPLTFSASDILKNVWNADASSVGVTVYAKTGDTIDFGAGVVATETAQPFVIHASSATKANATYNFAGTSFVGWTITDNVGLDWISATIQGGGTVTIAGGGDMTNCSITQTTSTNAALTITANGTTIATSTISCVMNTGASSAYHIALGASVTAITLNGVTLTGTPASGFKFYSALTSGELTITTDGTGTAIDSGDVEFAAGTAFATVVAPTVTADISITGMSNTVGANNRLQIINQTAAAAASRANSTAYSAGVVRLRQTGVGSENTAGLYLRCTTSGTSAGSPPTWNTTVGGTTTDGTVVWTTYAILYYNADPAATSLTDTYIDGEEFKAGETIEIRFAEEDPAVSFKIYSTSVIAATTGFSALANSTADSVYATYALSGAAYETTYSPNYVASYLVLDTNTNFTGASSFAYYCYLLTTSEGMYRFWGGMTALDAGNVRNNVDVLDLFFDETAGFVRQTDDVRIFKSDGTRPALDPTTGGAGIEINWKVPVNVVTTGGSAVLPQDILDIADAVWAKTLP